ncbi:Beta-barrel assembly-enhancing protease [compost metagenome]
MAAGMEALRVYDRDSSQEKAIEHFSTVLKHNPNNAAASAGLSLAFALRYAGNGRDDTWLQRADASAQQALALDNQLALTHIAHAYILELQGKQDRALTAIAIALNLDPHNLLGLAGKARLLIHAQKFDAVKQVLDSAITIYPRERLFPLILGTSLYRQANYSAAELAFRKSIELDPQSVNAYAYLNAVLLRQNRNDEALRVLQQGLQSQPHWELYNNLGTSLFAKGDYLGAILAFEKSVSSSRGNPGAYQLWANLADAQRWIPAQAQASRRSYQRAIELLSPILARMPDDATVNSRMALYSAYVGAKKEAVEKAARALAIAPSLPDIQFRAALTHELIGNHDAAMTALLEAVRLGYPINLIETAPDLLNLRRDARYQQFIINIKRDRKT